MIDVSSEMHTFANGPEPLFCHFWLQNGTPGVPPFSFFGPLERPFAAFSSKLVSKWPPVVPEWDLLVPQVSPNGARWLPIGAHMLKNWTKK